MMSLYFILSVITGLCLGSFFSVVLFRLDRDKGIWWGRSKCLQCLVQLKWSDLVPLFSWFFLKGKCRYCKTGIPFIYPFLELATAGVILFYVYQNGFYLNWPFFYYLTAVLLFLLLVFFDALYMILPDKITFSIIGLVLLNLLINPNIEWISHLVSGLVLGLVFAIIYIVSKGEWMGFGDVKLVFGIGLVLGYPLALFSVIAAVWTATAVGISMIVAGKANLKTALPFGSFLSASALIFIIFKNAIEQKINFIWYLI